MRYLIVIVVIVVLLFSCSPEREVQVECHRAVVVSIDRIVRWNHEDRSLITWKDLETNVIYKEFNDWPSPYYVGQRSQIRIRR